MGGTKAEQASRYRSMQVLLFVFSLIFFAIIAYGYFHLFLQFGGFLAFVFGTVMAVFAWYLARVIGTGEGGYRKHWILLIPLFVVSAAGVYNSLMLYLEGDQIVSDAASESQEQFAALQAAADRRLGETGATARVNRIRSDAEALYSEIRNPVNCGQGPEARRRIESLQQNLPGFVPLSNPAQACERNEDLIRDYQQRIDGLLERADWNAPALRNVVAQAGRSRQALEELRAGATANFSPIQLPQTVAAFETQDGAYRNLRQELSRQTEVSGLPPGLHLSEVQSLGNAFKLPALLIERMDEPVTWVYLLIALGFDLLMVHCFRLVAANRVRTRATSSSLAGAW